MSKNKNLVFDSELFEELHDRVSEKISGGGITVEGLLQDFNSLTLLDSNLLEKIKQEINKLYPNGLANAAALACATTTDGKLQCEVGTDGQKKEFSVPLY